MLGEKVTFRTLEYQGGVPLTNQNRPPHKQETPEIAGVSSAKREMAVLAGGSNCARKGPGVGRQKWWPLNGLNEHIVQPTSQTVK